MQERLIKLTHVLGEIIKEHRVATGKSMYKISAESSILKSTWRRIENGTYKDVNLSSVWKIAEGLEIPPEELIKELREKLGSDFSLIEE